MTIETKAREWAEKEYPTHSITTTIESLAYNIRNLRHRGVAERAYLAGAAGVMEWVPLTDGLPDPKIVGEKILVNRAVNDSQRGLKVSVYDTILLKLCEPETTYWMPLPPYPEKEQL